MYVINLFISVYVRYIWILLLNIKYSFVVIMKDGMYILHVPYRYVHIHVCISIYICFYCYFRIYFNLLVK